MERERTSKRKCSSKKKMEKETLKIHFVLGDFQQVDSCGRSILKG